MASKISNVDTIEPKSLDTGNNSAVPLKARSTRAEDQLTLKPLVGVRYDAPDAKFKTMEHRFYLFAKNVPAIAAIAWIITQPTGFVEWSAFALFYVMNILSMSIGYHRFFTHKAFETSKPMRYAIAILAQLGVYGCLRRWIAEHRRHHAHSDRPGDIHSPHYDDYGRELSGRKGWKYAHLGWVFINNMTDESIYGKGVSEDKAVMFVDKYRLLIFFASVIGLPALWALAFGGGTQLIIGTILIAGFLRCTAALHAIASVNSFGHLYGSQRFETSDKSRNNWIVALLTLGEGWHNNHHAHPRSANTGLAWYEIDMTSWIIWAMEKVGLVWNVRWAKLENGKTVPAKAAKS